MPIQVPLDRDLTLLQSSTATLRHTSLGSIMALLNPLTEMIPILLVMVYMTPQGIQEPAPKDIMVPPARTSLSSSRRRNSSSSSSKATLLPVAVAVRTAATAMSAFSSLSNLPDPLTPDMAVILRAR